MKRYEDLPDSLPNDEESRQIKLSNIKGLYVSEKLNNLVLRQNIELKYSITRKALRLNIVVVLL